MESVTVAERVPPSWSLSPSQAAQEDVLGLGVWRRSVAVGGDHRDLAVAAPVAPGAVLGLGDAVGSVVPPGRVAAVGVLGDLVGGAAGAVGLDDRGDHVLVEPVGDRVAAPGGFHFTGKQRLVLESSAGHVARRALRLSA